MVTVPKLYGRLAVLLLSCIILGTIILRVRSSDGEIDLSEFDAIVMRETKTYDANSYSAFDDVRKTLASSPVVIFSKSYCPHSRFVKDLLSQQYKFSPAPVVRELDLDEHGHEIQNVLNKVSGRRTVPNVFVAGKSLGGGDEMRALHKSGSLVQSFKRQGGKKLRVSPK
ncbi:thioredoxin-like protein [Dipodascopsis uninucleata]